MKYFAAVVAVLSLCVSDALAISCGAQGVLKAFAALPEPSHALGASVQFSTTIQLRATTTSGAVFERAPPNVLTLDRLKLGKETITMLVLSVSLR
ncbi:hypothetical protein BJX70DRAFT_66011 [Aspergillus crustosus]